MVKVRMPKKERPSRTSPRSGRSFKARLNWALRVGATRRAQMRILLKTTAVWPLVNAVFS
jgi:hypothetical protein